MDALTRRQFDRAMFAKERTLAIRVGDYASRDIKEASFEYGYIKGDTYKPGGTCAGSGKITFTSIITTFNKLDILHPEIGLLVGNAYQWVKMGEYFINDIEIDRNRNTTTLELMDGMFKLNREYVTDLHFPAEVREVIQEICLKTGIELANDYFGISAMRYHVEQVPEGKKLSFRDMLSAMTQMIGMSCFFNREGKMEIRDLTESNITINADSYFLHGLTKSEIEYQIAGITCKTDKKSLTVGMKTGRSLELDNVFMTQSALNDLYYKLKNLTYYPYNLNYQGHLLLEVGQWVTIQTNKKETFKVPVLSQSFTFKGGLRGRISADSKAGNDTQYSYEGTITKQIKQQDGIEAKIQAQIEAADAAFDAEFKKRKKEIDDGIELAKAKAEEVKQELSDTINQRFDSFDNGPLKEAKRKAEEALKNAGASSLLAQEAKQIGLDSIARLEAFKSQTTTTQTALSADLDVLKKTVASEVNQASEYRRTTTEALSRMTGQMNGFVTKSEVKQDIDGLTQTFAKMKVGGRNYYRDSEKVRTSTRFFSFPLHPYLSQENVGETWTLSFDIKINEGGEIRPLLFYHYQNNRFGLKASANITPSKEWQRFTFTGPVIFSNDDPRYSRGEMALYDYAGNNNYSVRRIKFEKGTLATDWSPAIEDTDGLITEAKATFERTAQGLRTDLSAIQEYVNKDGQRQEALQRYTREESAKQATAVRELVNRDFVGKSTYQEDVRGLERRFEAITNPQNGSIATQIANYKTAVDGRFADISSLLSGKANQSDFQRVKETSQLYERILGNTENGIADKVARMAMTNQLFQVEVGKAFAEHQNLFLTSTLTKGFLGNNGIIYVANATQKEVTSDFISVNPNEKIIFQHWVTLPENGMAWTAWQFFDKNKNPIDNRKSGLNAYKTTVGKQHNINQITVPANAYFVRFSARMYDDGLIKVEKGSAPSDYSVAPNDALEAVKTVQSQLAGSWAVQNINSAGDIISGINLGANGHNRFDGKLTHITGETLIDNAVIKSAMVDKLKTANFEAGSVTTKILDAEAVTADKVRFDDAFIRKMIANEAFINQLTSKRIFATKVESVVSSSTFLEAYQGRIGGFTLGQFDQGGGRWISGVNQFSVGMGNGAGYGVRTAFWANWGNNWNYAGPKAWNVNTDGKMYCRNEVGFYDQVDFSNASRANFYGTTTFSRSPVFSNGIELGSKDVFGDGSNPKGGRNAVVWWNQVGSGSVKYWMEQKSDRRLKENITDTAVKALDKINRLRMVAFDFVESKKHEEIGLIAQEAETIVPRIVSRDPENPDGYLHIDYTALVPYLIKAIQELNQKIEKMEKTIA
nr:MAG TPA: Neck appendage protein [Caudoviricetes sp.]